MTNLMNEMIKEASSKIEEKGYAFARRQTEAGEVLLAVQLVNTNSKNNEFRKNWLLNGKRIAASKLVVL